MQITHLGHSAVLVESAGVRILIDPGAFSAGWHSLEGLDAVLVTHQHPDHIDPVHVPALLEANPDVRVIVEPSVSRVVELARSEPLSAGGTTAIGSVTIEAVGGDHAIIHRDIPTIGNIGLLLKAEGEPTFFHPGDSLAACPPGVDVVAMPAMGPWAALKEHIDFARELAAPLGFGIHNALLNERGWGLMAGRVDAMSPTAVHDLRDHRPRTVTAGGFSA
ncbi:MAG: MBL fold metallo-hydrolase [Cumulibacter sp.]